MANRILPLHYYEILSKLPHHLQVFAMLMNNLADSSYHSSAMMEKLILTYVEANCSIRLEELPPDFKSIFEEPEQESEQESVSEPNNSLLNDKILDTIMGPWSKPIDDSDSSTDEEHIIQ